MSQGVVSKKVLLHIVSDELIAVLSHCASDFSRLRSSCIHEVTFLSPRYSSRGLLVGRRCTKSDDKGIRPIMNQTHDVSPRKDNYLLHVSSPQVSIKVHLSRAIIAFRE
ncbi:uncharacterized protein Bfra_009855 [Botrytis fragariae]|uniref:Uncharacterized protein n=1 Tax=Botrytis fragariae TaxID=1964551 RepID=A0A8H6EFQ3_9HELO|nr:uncharacterized protein Bfra_009855 [Botrytis fragariae]KAF5870468.1 hypothetical protein Bfra_009855 [Botrytis fragariae]